MKKTISLLLALIMLVGCASIYSAGAAETPAQITLNGTAYSFVTGTDITYTCNLLSASTVGNGQFTLNYPEKLLSIKDVSFPNINTVVRNWTENLENKLKLNFTNYNGFDFTTSKVLFQVKFTVVGSGSGEISLDKEVLSNVNNVNILNNATFTETLEGTKYVEPTAPPTEPATYVVTDPTESIKITTEKPVAKKVQKITAKSYKKTYGSKAFSLKAKTSGDGKLTYSSSNKKVVTVSAKGKVTVKGCGKATITIRAAATSKYKSAVKKITVTVKPGKMKLKTFKGNKKALKIYYTKQKNADGYQCIYNRGSKKIKTTSRKNYVTLKKLQKGTCIAQVRAYKKIAGKMVYGKFSKYKLTVG